MKNCHCFSFSLVVCINIYDFLWEVFLFGGFAVRLDLIFFVINISVSWNTRLTYFEFWADTIQLLPISLYLIPSIKIGLKYVIRPFIMFFFIWDKWNVLFQTNWSIIQTLPKKFYYRFSYFVFHFLQRLEILLLYDFLSIKPTILQVEICIDSIEFSVFDAPHL